MSVIIIPGQEKTKTKLEEIETPDELERRLNTQPAPDISAGWSAATISLEELEQLQGDPEVTKTNVLSEIEDYIKDRSSHNLMERFLLFSKLNSNLLSEMKVQLDRILEIEGRRVLYPLWSGAEDHIQLRKFVEELARLEVVWRMVQDNINYCNAEFRKALPWYRKIFS